MRRPRHSLKLKTWGTNLTSYNLPLRPSLICTYWHAVRLSSAPIDNLKCRGWVNEVWDYMILFTNISSLYTLLPPLWVHVASEIYQLHLEIPLKPLWSSCSSLLACSFILRRFRKSKASWLRMQSCPVTMPTTWLKLLKISLSNVEDSCLQKDKSQVNLSVIVRSTLKNTLCTVQMHSLLRMNFTTCSRQTWKLKSSKKISSSNSKTDSKFSSLTQNLDLRLMISWSLKL